MAFFDSASTFGRAAWWGLLLASAVTIVWHLASNGLAHLMQHGAFFPGSSIPIPTRPDAFYFLDAARDIFLAGGSGSPAVSIPAASLLPRLTAFLASFFSLAWVALLLPVILSLSMVLAIVPWGCEIRRYDVAMVSALLGLCAPFWIERTQLGALDTDILIPFFVTGAIYCLHVAGRAQKPRKQLALVVFVGFAVLLHFWWKPGPYFLLPPCLFWGGQWLLNVAKGKNRKRLALMATGFAVLVLVFLVVAGYATAAFRFVWSHACLVLGIGSQSLEQASIIELAPLTVRQWFEHALGAWFLFPLPLVGIYAWWRRFRMNSFYLFYIAALGLLGLLSERFLILGLPAIAVLTLYGGVQTWQWIAKVAGSRLVRLVTYAVLVILPIVPNVLGAISYVPDPYFSAADVAMCERINKKFPDSAFVWTWWDYGYFVRYLTKNKVFFHGGSQDPDRLFTAAYPLMQPDPRYASQWLRHYSQRQGRPFPSPYGKGAKPRLPSHRALSALVSGAHRVVLYLPRRTFNASGYLYAIAFGLPKEQVVNRLDLFSAAGFDFSSADGSVGIPAELYEKGYREFGSVYDPHAQPLSDAELASLPDPILVHSSVQPFVAITDRFFIRTTMFHLLGFRGQSPGFQRVWFDPMAGGLWEVVDVPVGGHTTEVQDG
ncbi:undecaprenyl-diphosphooligosaccharide---protein glycotransferase [Paucidesulfovibrio gracilis DSM 16080]|uniref:Undecaprenyl-diphosphooligosaccharide---protein glycotransferase n=2 Tax=Paucidesulfovibrio TaxID=2910985 RepID=A0A1T4W2L7_9BACT|nr:undecaprenyl-diphosphooligosaccharide---protein glycotransferase [Paucidesulfovibrio gracilis DSM 16080]